MSKTSQKELPTNKNNPYEFPEFIPLASEPNGQFYITRDFKHFCWRGDDDFNRRTKNLVLNFRIAANKARIYKMDETGGVLRYVITDENIGAENGGNPKKGSIYTPEEREKWLKERLLAYFTSCECYMTGEIEFIPTYEERGVDDNDNNTNDRVLVGLSVDEERLEKCAQRRLEKLFESDKVVVVKDFETINMTVGKGL